MKHLLTEKPNQSKKGKVQCVESVSVNTKTRTFSVWNAVTRSVSTVRQTIYAQRSLVEWPWSFHVCNSCAKKDILSKKSNSFAPPRSLNCTTWSTKTFVLASQISWSGVRGLAARTRSEDQVAAASAERSAHVDLKHVSSVEILCTMRHAKCQETQN